MAFGFFHRPEYQLRSGFLHKSVNESKSPAQVLKERFHAHGVDVACGHDQHRDNGKFEEKYDPANYLIDSIDKDLPGDD
ncbi:MAG: hypothetical protein Q9160_004073 [Pyrenula sp. 1 TL-2023]